MVVAASTPPCWRASSSFRTTWVVLPIVSRVFLDAVLGSSPQPARARIATKIGHRSLIIGVPHSFGWRTAGGFGMGLTRSLSRNPVSRQDTGFHAAPPKDLEKNLKGSAVAGTGAC